MRNNILLGWLALCLLLFELFSYSSSYEALYGIFGISSWAGLIAFSLCVVDFAGLGKLMVPGMEKDDSAGYLLGAWLLSAVGDTFLTYIVIADELRRNLDTLLVARGVIGIDVWTTTIPIAFAVLVWIIQVGLVASLSRTIDRISPKYTSREHSRNT